MVLVFTMYKMLSHHSLDNNGFQNAYFQSLDFSNIDSYFLFKILLIVFVNIHVSFIQM